MPSLSRFHWLVKLKGFHKIHITGGTEFGEPLQVTLCGKTYDPADRTSAKKTKRATGTECGACLAIIEKAWKTIYDDCIELGKSDAIARKAANLVFEIPD
jgi:hypothetical protein